MATQLYLRAAQSGTPGARGYRDTNLQGSAQAWNPSALSTTIGTGLGSTLSRTTITGPVTGLEISNTTEFLSMPLAANATISGTITFRIYAWESAMTTNATVAVIVERLSRELAVVSTIANSSFVTELGTAKALKSWTVTATSTNMLKGERIRVRVYADDGGGTMASGTASIAIDGSLANTADSSVQFNEDLTFMAVPSGTNQLFLSSRELGYPQAALTPVEFAMVASDGAASDQFGFSVDLASFGKMVAMGAHYAEEVAGQEGVLYLRSGSYWQTETKKTASDAAATDTFGHIVRMSSDGTIVAVSAPLEDGAGTTQGKVYVLSGSSWGTETQLTPGTRQDNAYFGDALDMSYDGAVVVVGEWARSVILAEGAAYLFKGASWGTRVDLIPSDTLQSSDCYGAAVAVSGNGQVIAVSAPGYDGGGTNIGKVYLFDASGTQIGSVTGTDGNGLYFGGVAGSNPYGRSLALNGDGSVLCVSEIVYNSSRGCVWVFDGPGWSTATRLTASDAAASDQFGYAVDIDAAGTTIVASCVRGQGRLYIKSGLRWASELNIAPATSEPGQGFGEDIAIDPAGTIVACSAPYFDSGSAIVGRVSFFNLGRKLLTVPPSPLPLDTTRTAIVGGGAAATAREYLGVWYTDNLAAATLTGIQLVVVDAIASSGRCLGAEIAVVNSDGSGESMFGAACSTGLTTSYAGYTLYISGQDLPIARGQRLRLRLFMDDGPTSLRTANDTDRAGIRFDGNIGAPLAYLATDVTLRALHAEDQIMNNKGPASRMSIISANSW